MRITISDGKFLQVDMKEFRDIDLSIPGKITITLQDKTKRTILLKKGDTATPVSEASFPSTQVSLPDPPQLKMPEKPWLEDLEKLNKLVEEYQKAPPRPIPGWDQMVSDIEEANDGFNLLNIRYKECRDAIEEIKKFMQTLFSLTNPKIVAMVVEMTKKVDPTFQEMTAKILKKGAP